MNKSLHRIELFVDKIIPYLVIMLLIIIIIELSFGEKLHAYDLYVEIFDYMVVAVFCIDLVFKYLKIRKIPIFFRKHWIDIMAVFPFFLVFRLFHEVYIFASMPKLLTEQPSMLREGVILEKEGLRLVRAAEETGKMSRTRFLFKFIKPLQRFPRLLKIIPYFERPTKKHHEAIESISKEKSKKDK